jgi:hypothetical protein
MIRNVGRWESLQQLLVYLSEGVQIRNIKLRDNKGTDPITSFWVFNFETAVSAMDTSGKVLAALHRLARGDD